MGAFEDFVNAELPRRVSVASIPGGGNFADDSFVQTTGVGLAVEPSVVLTQNTSAVLISTKALGLPNLTTIQRNALTPSDGYTIWNTDAGETQVYNGTIWTTIAGGGTLAATLVLGNTTGGTDISVTTGDSITGAAELTLAAAAGVLDIDATGNVSINSSAGLINIGNDDVDQNINIGTVGERTITIGNTVGATNVLLQAASGNLVKIAGDAQITGDLNVFGTTTSVETINLQVQDNFIYLNDGYESTAKLGGGCVVNYGAEASPATINVASGGFTAGIPSTSNPTVAVDTASGLSAGDLIQVHNANNQANDGIYEVKSHSGSVITIQGVGLTSTTEPFPKNNFTTDATVEGTIRKVNVSAIQTNTAGIWEVGKGITTSGWTWNELATAAGSTLQSAYDAGDGTIVTDATGNFAVSGTQGATFDMDAASSFNVTGNSLTLSTTTSGVLDIDAAGVLSLNSSGAAINVGNDAVAQAINIGTGASARTISIGNATGATALDIDAGTGGVLIDSTGVISLDGVGSSNVTTDSGNLTISTTTSGALLLTSAGALTVDVEADSTVNVAGNWTLVLDETQVADSGTAGNVYAVTSGTGAVAGASSAGGTGGALNITGGAGGAASASQNDGGTGATVTITGGTGGAGATAQTSGAGGDLLLVGGPVGAASGGSASTDHGRVAFTSGTTQYYLTDVGVGPALATTAQTIIEAINEAASSGGEETLAETLTFGNSTGGVDISVTTGDSIIGAAELTLSAVSGVMDLDATGAVSINSSGGAINVGNDAVAQAINVGTGAAARTITIGNGTGASAVVLNTGTGSLDLGTNAVAHEVNIGTLTGTGGVTINAGTGGIDIGGSASVAAMGLNFGTGGTGAKTVVVGSTASTSATTLQTGTGAMILTAGGIFDVNATGAVTIDGTTVGITGSSLTTITGDGINLVGGSSEIDVTTTGALDLNSGVYTLNCSTCDIDGTSVVSINSSGGAINVGNDAVAQNINVGTGAAARIITIGNTSGASSVVLNAGTGNIDIGTGAQARTVKLATGAAVQVVSIGSNSGASSLLLDAGSGGTILDSDGTLTIDVEGNTTLNCYDYTILLDETQTAGSTVAGNPYSLTAGTGAAADAAAVGGVGGSITILAGTGGVANANPQDAGAGGTFTITAGTGGAGAVGATSGAGGDLLLKGGAVGAAGGGSASTDHGRVAFTSGTTQYYLTDTGVGPALNTTATTIIEAINEVSTSAQTVGSNGQTFAVKQATAVVSGMSGASATASSIIPANAIVMGVVTRVDTDITGASSFKVGDSTDDDAWGAGLTLTTGDTSDPGDFTAAVPVIYDAAEDVVLTATGGDFTAGAVRVVVNYIELGPPTS